MPDSGMRSAEVELTNGQGAIKLKGMLLEADYVTINEIVKIRLTIKGSDGTAYEAIDEGFRPYFYFSPRNPDSLSRLKGMIGSPASQITSVEPDPRSIFGKQLDSYRVYVRNPTDVPKTAESIRNLGETYEYDIPFAKRYLIDMDIPPLTDGTFTLEKANGYFLFKGFEKSESMPSDYNLNTMCFDIETYSSLGIPRPEQDPVIMISYTYTSHGKRGNGVITFKKINRPFVEYVENEEEMLKRFIKRVSDLDIDIISGYNSANFDLKYLTERAKALKMDFNLSRFSGETRIERHGLVDKVKIGGRVHIDMYLVVKFIAVVGAAESILKLNSYTLKNVYDAISKDEKLTVEKTAGQKWKDINELWNGSAEDLELLADYNLSDSESLRKVYETFMPITVELSRTTGNSLSDVAVSTTGQLVEFMLMRYAHEFNELIPNKPTEYEIKSRLMDPIEGAYVKTPDPGIYENLAIFDFRGLYPSIIISHNIDPSSLCKDCTDYYESPTGDKFSKSRKAIIPTILDLLIKQRAEVKKLYKKDKDNIFLGSRSQALKITSNSFYGYMGYARSRWYSRECAASVMTPFP
ncbi:DNA-directed DNA polymerase, partial [Candidatus Marsarchaeota archaeon]|nr:DNA-directed DNA polymerase [Candidatus Marsarchaeota archaeon]